MKRIVIRALLAVLILAGIAPFALPLRDGQPLLDYRKLRAPQPPDLALPTLGIEAPPVAVYKWRDAQGALHFGDAPPPDTPFETVTVDPGANLISALAPPPADAVQPAPALAANPLNNYSPVAIQQTLDQARAVQSMMDARHAAQDAAIGAR